VFKTEYEKFVIKTAILVLSLIIIIDIMFLSHKWLAIIGLLIGAVFGMLKFGITAALISKIISYSERQAVSRNIIMYLICLVLTAVIFFVSAHIHTYILIGMAEGVLLIPFTLFIICLGGGTGFIKKYFNEKN